jgi:predicted DNA-binding ArsR family transcriptional regulator
MNNQNEQLHRLQKRLEEIEPILSKTFNTDKELNAYLEKNKSLYEEGKSLYEQIQQLEWELMTPEEREKREEHLKLMKLKREGKL